MSIDTPLRKAEAAYYDAERFAREAKSDLLRSITEYRKSGNESSRDAAEAFMKARFETLLSALASEAIALDTVTEERVNDVFGRTKKGGDE